MTDIISCHTSYATIRSFWCGLVRSALAGAGIVLAVSTLSGCAVIHAEENYRGGYANKIMDDHLVHETSKGLRVLRAIAIFGTLAEIASNNVQGQSNITAVMFQENAAAYDIGAAFAVADSKRNLDKTGCTLSAGSCYDPTFDLHMKLVTDDLFRLSALCLSQQDLKELVNSVESGNYLGGLGALWNVAFKVQDTTRSGFAGYRDLMDANAAVISRSKVESVSSSYNGSDGDFKSYAAAVDSYFVNADRSQVPEVTEGDFFGWFKLTSFSCKRAGWDKLVTFADALPIGTCDHALAEFSDGRTK